MHTCSILIKAVGQGSIFFLNLFPTNGRGRLFPRMEKMVMARSPSRSQPSLLAETPKGSHPERRFPSRGTGVSFFFYIQAHVLL